MSTYDHTKIVMRQRNNGEWHCTMYLYRFWWFRLWPQVVYTTTRSTVQACQDDFYVMLDKLGVHQP